MINPFGPFSSEIDMREVTYRQACRKHKSESSSENGICVDMCLSPVVHGHTVESNRAKSNRDYANASGPFPVEVSVMGEGMEEIVDSLCAIFPNRSKMYLDRLITQTVGYGKTRELSRILNALTNDDCGFLPHDFTDDSCAIRNKRQTAKTNCKNLLKSIFPQIDKNYLAMKAKFLTKKSDKTKFKWIESSLQNKLKGMPLEAKNIRKNKVLKMFDTEFDVTPDQFVDLPSSPSQHFSRKRKVSETYKQSSLYYLRTRFYNLSGGLVRKVLVKNDFLLYPSYKELLQIPKVTEKIPKQLPASLLPLDLEEGILTEIRYCRNEKQIERYLQNRKVDEWRKYQKAKQEKSLSYCSCCWDKTADDNIYKCEEGHGVCKNCILGRAKKGLAEGTFTLGCIGEWFCKSQFSLETLKKAAPRQFFEKWRKTRDNMEVKKAVLSSTVSCPRCCYFEIPDENVPKGQNPIFECKNPDCKVKTCRICGKESHIPLRCDEAGNDLDLVKRLIREEKMKDAMLNKCRKCGRRFYKEFGCNRIYCVCGNSQCYLCGKTTETYVHFDEIDPLTKTRCPLVSFNDRQDAKARGIKEAKRAVKELKMKLFSEDRSSSDEESIDSPVHEEYPSCRIG